DRLEFGCARPRVPSSPRLRHAGRRERDRPRRPSPPHRAHVRSRGGASDERTSRAEGVRGGGSAVKPAASSGKKTGVPKELLRALRQIEILTSRLATDALAGTYSSVFRGQGIVFREVRPYQP